MKLHTDKNQKGYSTTYKRILSVVITVILVASLLSGCGEKEVPTTPVVEEVTFVSEEGTEEGLVSGENASDVSGSVDGDMTEGNESIGEGAEVTETETQGNTAAKKTHITCGEAAELLAIHCDAYTTATAQTILEDIPENAPLTRQQGCDMLLRAFGPLPIGNSRYNYLVAYRECDFTDVSEGNEAVNNLVNAGLYIPEDNSVFGPEEEMFREELLVLVDRIHAYLHTSLKDDYYSCVASDYTEASEYIGDNLLESSYDNSAYHSDVFDDWYEKLLEEVKEHAEEPLYQNAAAFFSTYVDAECRKKGMEVLDSYLNMIKLAENGDELLQACIRICNDTGLEIVLREADYADLLEADEKGAYFVSSRTGVGAGFAEKANLYEAYVAYFGRYVALFSDTEEEYRHYMHELLDVYYMDASIAAEGEAPLQSEIVALTEIKACCPDFPLEEYLQGIGCNSLPESIVVSDGYETAFFFSAFADPQYLDALKVLVAFSLLSTCQIFFDLETYISFNGLEDAYSLDDLLANDLGRERSLNATTASLIRIFETDGRFDASKEYSERVFEDIKAYYLEMLNGEDWLEDNTREYAKAKLDAMTLYSLWPENYTDFPEGTYISKEDGGSLMENVFAYYRAYHAESLKLLGASFLVEQHLVLARIWTSTPYAILENNALFFPIGFFVYIQDEDGLTDEEYYAEVGWVMGHEISHNFDSEGASYGIDGTLTEWWTERDYEAFKERWARLATYYQNYEVAPGLRQSGEKIIGECVSDVASLKCIMSIVKDIEDFDYDIFFQTMTRTDCVTATRWGMKTYIGIEPHAIGRSRINRMFSLIDEFYETYDIDEDDAMYVAPEDRPVVW